MDLSTALGLAFGGVVLVSLILMGGELRHVRRHPRLHRHLRRLDRRDPDPLPALVAVSRPAARHEVRLHVAPHGPPATWSTRSPKLAEVARKPGPIGLEKVEIEDTFLAKGMRFVADGYDADFIRDNLERDLDNFLHPSRRRAEDLPRHRRLRAGLRHDRHADRHGADVRQHDRPFQARSLYGGGAAGDVLRRRGRQPVLPADRRQAARQAASTRRSTAR